MLQSRWADAELYSVLACLATTSRLTISMKRFAFILSLIAMTTPADAADRPSSNWATIGSDGKLVYDRDAQGNRLPDFSNCGYGGGGVALPTVPIIATVHPEPGDMTAALQKAIDAIGELPADARGMRGAVLLSRGTYHISGTLRVGLSGIVLRGEGQ